MGNFPANKTESGRLIRSWGSLENLSLEDSFIVMRVNVAAVSVLRGYGFVQFIHEADAREAVRMENGGLLKGNKLGTVVSGFILERCRRDTTCGRQLLFICVSSQTKKIGGVLGKDKKQVVAFMHW